MEIAIIGSGISGLASAYFLSPQHSVSVFESEPRMGGHTATIDVELAGQNYAIDTGFIVFNDRTYPLFNRLLAELGVAHKPTTMGFSVKVAHNGLEYAGNNLASLFAQPKRLLSPSHWAMLRDILRFNQRAKELLQKEAIDPELKLGDYLDREGFGSSFVDYYLLPMASAIWSASVDQIRQFQLLFFVRFFFNHGLLNIDDRPQWSVIEGGSKQYIEPLIEGFSDRIHCGVSIQSVSRRADGVDLHMPDGSTQSFDQVIFACHSDQALELIADATEQERSVLSAIPYAENDVVLHTDHSLLPESRRCWSAWNYWLREPGQAQAVLTYNMNILQGIEAPETFCVSMNANDAIDEEKILGKYRYAHPQFSAESERAAARWDDINGVHRTWFAGAYWANGFHEDGVRSALRVAEALGVDW